MKARKGFVSNSSSTSYTVDDDEEAYEAMQKLKKKLAEQPLSKRNKGRNTCVQCGKHLFVMGRTVICTTCEKD